MSTRMGRLDWMTWVRGAQRENLSKLRDLWRALESVGAPPMRKITTRQTKTALLSFLGGREDGWEFELVIKGEEPPGVVAAEAVGEVEGEEGVTTEVEEEPTAETEEGTEAEEAAIAPEHEIEEGPAAEAEGQAPIALGVEGQVVEGAAEAEAEAEESEAAEPMMEIRADQIEEETDEEVHEVEVEGPVEPEPADAGDDLEIEEVSQDIPPAAEPGRSGIRLGEERPPRVSLGEPDEPPAVPRRRVSRWQVGIIALVAVLVAAWLLTSFVLGMGPLGTRVKELLATPYRATPTIVSEPVEGEGIVGTGEVQGEAEGAVSPPAEGITPTPIPEDDAGPDSLIEGTQCRPNIWFDEALRDTADVASLLSVLDRDFNLRDGGQWSEPGYIVPAGSVFWTDLFDVRTMCVRCEGGWGIHYTSNDYVVPEPNAGGRWMRLCSPLTTTGAPVESTAPEAPPPAAPATCQIPDLTGTAAQAIDTMNNWFEETGYQWGNDFAAGDTIPTGIFWTNLGEGYIVPSHVTPVRVEGNWGVFQTTQPFTTPSGGRYVSCNSS